MKQCTWNSLWVKNLSNVNSRILSWSLGIIVSSYVLWFEDCVWDLWSILAFSFLRTRLYVSFKQRLFWNNYSLVKVSVRSCITKWRASYSCVLIASSVFNDWFELRVGRLRFLENNWAKLIDFVVKAWCICNFWVLKISKEIISLNTKKLASEHIRVKRGFSNKISFNWLYLNLLQGVLF